MPQIVVSLGLALLLALGLADLSSAAQTQVTISGDDFRLNDRVTYSGRTAVTLASGRTASLEGLLMNARMINAAFDDDNAATEDNWDYPSAPWDPNRNVSEFVAQLPNYRAKGLLMVTVGLQGGNPAYESASGNGDPPQWIVSAFAADGSLRTAWMSRVARIIEAADAQGMVVNLQLFYQRQESRLSVPSRETAAKAAVDNVADWIVARGYRNVLVEIQNEVKAGFWSSSSIFGLSRAHELIDRMHARQPSLLVGTSTLTSIDPSAGELDDIIASSDFVSIHANGLSTTGLRALIDEIQNRPALRADPKPVLVTEDPNVLAKMDVALEEGVSWGYHDPGYSPTRPFGNYVDGFQAMPGQWRINTTRKSSFFNLLERYTGGSAPAPPGEPAPSEGSAVESLTLIDADSDAPVPGYEIVAPGATLNLATLPTRRLNIRANPAAGWSAGGVRFGLDGDASFRTETGAPFALWGNSGGDYDAWTPTLGDHTVTATPVDGSGVTAGPTLSVQFNVIDAIVPTPTPTPDPGPRIESFTLIDAAGDRPIAGYEVLEDGATLDLDALPTRELNVRANPAAGWSGVSAVSFASSDLARLELTAPYALAGNVGGDYRSWTPDAGAHTISAVPIGSGGEAIGPAFSIDVTVID